MLLSDENRLSDGSIFCLLFLIRPVKISVDKEQAHCYNCLHEQRRSFYRKSSCRKCAIFYITIKRIYKTSRQDKTVSKNY